MEYLIFSKTHRNREPNGGCQGLGEGDIEGYYLISIEFWLHMIIKF